MKKKYIECMKFLVYYIIGYGYLEKPMYKLLAQFDEEDTAKLFIKNHKEINNRKYVLLNNLSHEEVVI